jgi:diguanylate cyclase (GGDEF)-like protein
VKVGLLKGGLRRFGVWPVVGMATLISVLVSLAITAFVHIVVLGEPMPTTAWILSIGCPLILAPTMSTGSFALLLKLDQAHEKLRLVSDIDYLTGAYNRRFFMDRLRDESERHSRGGPAFSVALIDVDNFKAVNDRHGHLAGDEVLCALAQACRSNMRSIDTFARFGGEEFAVLLPQTNAGQAVQWLERLRQAVADLRVEMPGGGLCVTVSIGVASPQATAIHPAMQMDAALRMADEALYRAKRDGKNRVAQQETTG